MDYDNLLSYRLLPVFSRNLLAPSSGCNLYAIYQEASSETLTTNYWSGECHAPH
jgi:hypothetical protein